MAMLRMFLIAVAFVSLTTAAQGGTFYVANDGVDGSACGPKKSPCRSISQAVNTRAADGDKVIVGPGIYGDLNGNGTLGDSPGEETGGFDCVLLISRRVSLTSSDGAAVTVIDGRLDATGCNVGIVTDGTQFGKAGKGFTVTNTASATGSGIVINATNVQVQGNQIVATGMGSSTFGVGGPGTFLGTGILTVNSTQTILIESNQLVGWSGGIFPQGAGKTIRKNVLALNNDGIVGAISGDISGNIVVANGIGIGLGLTANGVGNAVYGNLYAGLTVNATPFSGALEKNDFAGNGYPTFSASPNCGVYVPGPTISTVVAAPNNYWGAATGPGADPGDVACSAGTVTSAPFASKAFKVKAPIKP
jgi:hypothetical protein